MNALNSGAVAAPGLSYINQLLYYSRDELKDAGGAVQASGHHGVMLAMNTVAWVSGQTGFLGGAYVSATATIPLASNSLTSDSIGPMSGGSGLGDTFYQPLILGWRGERLESRAAVGFLAPTGRFDATRSDNVGSGYWTYVVSTGHTLHFGGSRSTSLSAFAMYEWHGEQEGTGIHPGQNLNLDYSLVRRFRLSSDVTLQAGAMGYAQWQTTARSGPSLTPADVAARFRVYGLGAAAQLSLPRQRVTTGLRFVQEFASRSTFEGITVQVNVSVHF